MNTITSRRDRSPLTEVESMWNWLLSRLEKKRTTITSRIPIFHGFCFDLYCDLFRNQSSKWEFRQHKLNQINYSEEYEKMPAS